MSPSMPLQATETCTEMRPLKPPARSLFKRSKGGLGGVVSKPAGRVAVGPILTADKHGQLPTSNQDMLNKDGVAQRQKAKITSRTAGGTVVSDVRRSHLHIATCLQGSSKSR